MVYLRSRFLYIALFLSMVGLVSLRVWGEDGWFSSPQDRWDSLEDALIALMGEYTDRPKTIFGRISQLLLLIFGTVVFGAIVGKVSSLFVTQALAQEKPMKLFRDHIIICNWNEKAPAIVEQLLEAHSRHPRDIVIVSASEIEDRSYFRDTPNVFFVQADPTHHAALEKIHALRAKSVILLADQATEWPDDKNAIIALAIKHLEQIPGHGANIHVVGELVNLDRRRHLKEAGVDELISARDYSSGIIAQSAIFSNMSVVYQQLLTYSDDSNEFYFIEPGNYPQSLYDKTFKELSLWIGNYNTAHLDNPLLLVGIKRSNGEILLNPKRRYFERLAADDSLIVMAFNDVGSIL